jgi:hypothetical protein
MFMRCSVVSLLSLSFVFCVYAETESSSYSDYLYTYRYEKTNKDWHTNNYGDGSETVVIKSDDVQKYKDKQKERRRGIDWHAEVDMSEQDGDTPLALENIWGTSFSGFNSAKFGMQYNFD